MARVKRRDGRCPNCGGADFSTEQPVQVQDYDAAGDPVLVDRADRTAIKCTACNDWSMRDRRGVVYPVEDVTDPNSPPAHALP